MAPHLLLFLLLLALGAPSSSSSYCSGAECEPPLELDVSHHTSSIIFLHGLGDSGAGWQGRCLHLQRRFPTLKCVLPTALPDPQWGGYNSWHARDRSDLDRTQFSAEMVRRLVDLEHNLYGIPYHRILLGGFSQGAGLAMFTAYTLLEHEIGGVVALSGRLPAKHTKTWDAVS